MQTKDESFASDQYSDRLAILAELIGIADQVRSKLVDLSDSSVIRFIRAACEARFDERARLKLAIQEHYSQET